MSREEARRRFKRIAAARANRIIKDLQLLTNCSDRKNYEYTEEQKDKIFLPIERALAQTKSHFVTKNFNRIEL